MEGFCVKLRASLESNVLFFAISSSLVNLLELELEEQKLARQLPLASLLLLSLVTPPDDPPVDDNDVGPPPPTDSPGVMTLSGGLARLCPSVPPNRPVTPPGRCGHSIPSLPPHRRSLWTSRRQRVTKPNCG